LNRPSFFFKLFGRRSLLVVLASTLLLIVGVAGVAPSQDGGAGEKESIRQLVRTYIEKAADQLDGGAYSEAEKTLLMAQNFQELLRPDQREQLQDMVDKAHILAVNRERADETFRAVNELILRDQLEQAKDRLDKIRNNQSLTDDERKQIVEVLKQLDSHIKQSKAGQEQAAVKRAPPRAEPKRTARIARKAQSELDKRKNEIAELYYRSLGYYKIGELRKAREGFIEVIASGFIPARMVQTIIEGYLVTIDARLGASVESKAVPGTSKDDAKMVAIAEPQIPALADVEAKVVRQEPGKEEAVEPNGVGAEAVEGGRVVASTSKGGYIELILRRRRILRSHTKAVVEDALNKAQSYLEQGEFEKAKRAIETGDFTVNENQVHLGDALYKEYNSRLKEKAGEILRKEDERNRELAEEKRRDAIKAERRLRSQMETDRQERIVELMASANAFARQYRYDAALGQLEGLLVLDPYNDNALTLKEALEDMVYFRKQRELEKEISKETAETLLETDEAGTPYVEEVTYPKNWLELIEKPTRKPDEPIGLDPEDMAVYRQLDEVVDLSQLTPTMPLSEAIDGIKNAVSPPLTMVVLWRDLYDNAEVEPTTEINMDGLPAVGLGTGLENLLKAVSGGFGDEIGYVVENGVITVATVGSLPSKLETRVYDVSDLVGQQANFRGMGGGMGGGMMGGGMMGGGMMGGGMMGGYGGGMMGGGMMGGYGGGMGGYGGGMGGYGGGMGGYGGGMGGYGGGMGGYGGGMGGYGGGMGGYGGGGYGGGGGQQAYEYGGGQYGGGQYGGGQYGGGYGGYGGGGGSQPKKLAVLQTREVHKKIEQLLAELRKSLGNQVSIEARFLVVSENFLEDIGLDLDFGYFGTPGKMGIWTYDQGSYLGTKPDVSTKVPGSLGGISEGMLIQGGYTGFILDNLQVSLLLRATQAHTDAKTLTAAKATVLSGETASFSVQTTVSYALPPDVEFGGGAGAFQGGGYQTSSVQQNVSSLQVGSSLEISPTIAHDKKHVLLYIITQLQDLLRMKSHLVEGPVGADGTVQQYTVTVPETETSQVMTRVSIPDGGTLLLGGQKITAEIEKQVGVPILSKIPLVGRLFENRSKIRDHKILLILVKPTIILQEERDAEAIAALRSES